MTDIILAPIILASGSSVRAQLLRNAGVDFAIVSSDVDESAIKDEMLAAGHDLADIAMRLAQEKARAVAASNPDALVIGADQILVLGGELHDKVGSMEAAAERLALLSGRTHTLCSAACICLGDEIVWQTLSTPRLTMQDLSRERIAAYLEAAGEGVLSSVGVYQLEGPGLRLFSEIEGDYFSILGLPLLPLLAFLQSQQKLAF